jgi:hypothetical protein
VACGEYLQFLPQLGVIDAGAVVGAAAATCIIAIGWLSGRRKASPA